VTENHWESVKADFMVTELGGFFIETDKGPAAFCTVGEKGVARNAHFDVLGYPVVPLPYALFPADSNRQSGFLSPRVGYSSLRGAQYMQPFYWAINKSSDATFALDVETNKRVGLFDEYRLQNGIDDYLRVDMAYVNEGLRSQASRVNDVVDTQIADPHIPIDRYNIIGMMRQHIEKLKTLIKATASRKCFSQYGLGAVIMPVHGK